VTTRRKTQGKWWAEVEVVETAVTARGEREHKPVVADYLKMTGGRTDIMTKAR
jgi:hypothetical protein